MQPTSTESTQSAAPGGRSPDDALPPVEAPSMKFVFQLFVVPLLIVSIIVVIWLGINWMVSMGSSPEQYIKDLQNPGKGSWQSAAALADILRNPRNEELKSNPALANQLAEVLDSQVEKGDTSEHAIKLRIFLARSLGEFYVTSGLPALVNAASTRREPIEIEVQRASIEAIAVLADNTDPEKVLEEPGLLVALMKASQSQGDGGEEVEKAHGELRARAAFTLGVLGGDKAIQRLVDMTSDGFPNARYNAGIGLARNGDLRGEPVLVQMLDPDNQAAIEGEENAGEIVWKRALVIMNGLEATEQLAVRQPDAKLENLQDAVKHLSEAELDPLLEGHVRTRAKEVLHRMEELPTATP